jgi:hypothetical protein
MNTSILIAMGAAFFVFSAHGETVFVGTETSQVSVRPNDYTILEFPEAFKMAVCQLSEPEFGQIKQPEHAQEDDLDRYRFVSAAFNNKRAVCTLYLASGRSFVVDFTPDFNIIKPAIKFVVNKQEKNRTTNPKHSVFLRWVLNKKIPNLTETAKKHIRYRHHAGSQADYTLVQRAKNAQYAFWKLEVKTKYATHHNKLATLNNRSGKLVMSMIVPQKTRYNPQEECTLYVMTDPHTTFKEMMGGVL